LEASLGSRRALEREQDGALVGAARQTEVWGHRRLRRCSLFARVWALSLCPDHSCQEIRFPRRVRSPALTGTHYG